MSASDFDAWEERLRANQPPTEREMKLLCRLAQDILIEESNVVTVQSPAVLCGDIHGQFPDLLYMFQLSGEIKDGKFHYVFLGDLVDRGANSVETIAFLLLLKVRYPTRITLIRGNHETRSISATYGFYDECQKKYGSADVWNLCMETFDCLPLSALVDERNLCLHGGLSPELRSVHDLFLIDRLQEIPNTGLFSDIVWSDPENVDEWQVSQRGAGWLFGAAISREFLHVNKFHLLARAHQLADKGYKYHFDEEHVLTVWSAPNYCYRCGNLASVLRLYPDESREFLVFREVERQVPEAAKTRPAYFL